MLSFRRIVAALLIACTFLTSAQAAMVTTNSVLSGVQREQVMAALERADVRARMEAMGVRADDVTARIDALSDEELSRLAAGLESLPAGGDGIIGAIVFVFLILLITDILGLTKIFPFTRSVR